MTGISYATLAQLRAENKSGVTTDDSVLLDYGRQMTAAIDAYLKANYREAIFAPRRVTRYYDAAGGKRLELDAWFVALTTVVDGETTTLVDGTDYYTVPRGQTPIQAIYRFDGTYWSAYSGDTPIGQIAITGDLCYREYYDEAWVTATTITEPLADTTATTLTTASNTVLSPGMLIRIDSEWMVVQSGATTSWVVTRGARGSTAATHLNNAVITYFQPEPNIVRACQRWASLAFSRRGAFEQTRFDGTASVQFPKSMPDEVRDMVIEGAWTSVRPVTV